MWLSYVIFHYAYVGGPGGYEQVTLRYHLDLALHVII
jgi:hypothetical protein